MSKLELDRDFIKEHFNCSNLGRQKEILKKAYFEFLNNLKINLSEPLKSRETNLNFKNK
ncbi:hypothetical protein GW796_06600 [archaeon]|nr:hypothetical protein [archaeon]